MYKVDPNVKEMLALPDQTTEELKEKYQYLVKELAFARNAYEFEKASEIKTEMVYMIEELKVRKKMKNHRFIVLNFENRSTLIKNHFETNHQDH
ncbi:hypothetical protein LGQ02_01105 [Bacillus shivajii]|uniref:hypothetical protein n=1 Tax=Bacillus shivajii TaxID=1983719 RepID=UPI001CFC2E01|nr:hypothetical protein [Bacillus shivajii]UCZ53429.1 hypothetical protein LGQ02_01105 [Bacillus shivajii]